MRVTPAVSLTLGALLAATCAAQAQISTPSVTTPPPLAYGYQPYNSGNPTGFNHPNDMGFGQYHNPTRPRGPRSAPLNYRHFKGY